MILLLWSVLLMPSVLCTSLETGESNYVGCYKDDVQSRLQESSGIKIFRRPGKGGDHLDKITPHLCSNKCREHGYQFAFIKADMVCMCDHTLGRAWSIPCKDMDPPCTCDRSCKDEPTSKCGGEDAISSVYKTGLKEERSEENQLKHGPLKKDAEKKKIKHKRQLKQKPLLKDAEKRKIKQFIDKLQINKSKYHPILNDKISQTELNNERDKHLNDKNVDKKVKDMTHQDDSKLEIEDKENDDSVKGQTYLYKEKLKDLHDKNRKVKGMGESTDISAGQGKNKELKKKTNMNKQKPKEVSHEKVEEMQHPNSRNEIYSKDYKRPKEKSIEKDKKKQKYESMKKESVELKNKEEIKSKNKKRKPILINDTPDGQIEDDFKKGKHYIYQEKQTNSNENTEKVKEKIVPEKLIKDNDASKEYGKKKQVILKKVHDRKLNNGQKINSKNSILKGREQNLKHSLDSGREFEKESDHKDDLIKDKTHLDEEDELDSDLREDDEDEEDVYDHHLEEEKDDGGEEEDVYDNHLKEEKDDGEEEEDVYDSLLKGKENIFSKTQACSAGYFGPGCKLLCHCDGGATCHHVEGSCPAGCSRGRFGQACQEVCHCVEGAFCDDQTGVCFNNLCAAHWTGHNCQEKEPEIGGQVSEFSPKMGTEAQDMEEPQLVRQKRPETEPPLKEQEGDTLKSGIVRLTGGSTAWSGRVEVFHERKWGSVCDDTWTDKAAVVVCHELGYFSGMATPGSTFGSGSGPIWMSGVDCIGTEFSLLECHHDPWGQTDCQHIGDAGVICKHAEAEKAASSQGDPGVWSDSPCDVEWDAGSAACRQYIQDVVHNKRLEMILVVVASTVVMVAVLCAIVLSCRHATNQRKLLQRVHDSETTEPLLPEKNR